VSAASTTTTPDRLAEIEARLAAGTPGLWEGPAVATPEPMTRDERAEWLRDTLNEGDDLHLWTVYVPGDGVTLIPAVSGDGPNARSNAELIAHAPADLAALVTVVKAVREIHRRVHLSDGRWVCAICPTTTPSGALVPTLYPCPTARALEIDRA
jgi:hypothetical protein